MSDLRFDITPFLDQDEGQHFDRKSLYEGEEGAKRPRSRRAVRDQVAEYIAAFANAGCFEQYSEDPEHAVAARTAQWLYYAC